MSKEDILEQHSDFVDSPERLEEGFALRTMLKDMPTKIEVGSEWFFLPKKWFDQWETFCYIDVIDATASDLSELRGV